MTKNNHLSQRQLRTLGIELEFELARLERALGAEARETLFSAPVLSNPSDGGEGNGLETATLTRARARHDAILDALERIAKDSYGSCVGCGNAIPFDRLLVMPETPYCVSCGARA